MGFKPKTAALLNTPSCIVTITSCLVSGFMIRRYGHRWSWTVITSLFGLIGGALMSFLPTSNRAGPLIGIYLVNAVVANTSILFGWAAANVAGSTKRSLCLALVNASFGVGSIVGPQTFQAKDAPQYYPAKVTLLATQAAAAFFATVLFGYYKWENSRRNKKGAAAGMELESTEQDWSNLTDKENPSFRYVY